MVQEEACALEIQDKTKEWLPCVRTQVLKLIKPYFKDLSFLIATTGSTVVAATCLVGTVQYAHRALLPHVPVTKLNLAS